MWVWIFHGMLVLMGISNMRNLNSNKRKSLVQIYMWMKGNKLAEAHLSMDLYCLLTLLICSIQTSNSMVINLLSLVFLLYGNFVKSPSKKSCEGKEDLTGSVQGTWCWISDILTPKSHLQVTPKYHWVLPKNKTKILYINPVLWAILWRLFTFNFKSIPLCLCVCVCVLVCRGDVSVSSFQTTEVTWYFL